MSEIDSKVKKLDHKTTVNSTLNILSVEFFVNKINFLKFVKNNFLYYFCKV